MTPTQEQKALINGSRNWIGASGKDPRFNGARHWVKRLGDELERALQSAIDGREGAEGVPPPLFVSSGKHLSGYRVELGYETLEEAQAAHSALVRPSTPPAGRRPGREEMARIIEPAAWRWKPLPREPNEGPASKLAYDAQDRSDTAANEMVKANSLAKADAILALFPAE